MSKSKQKIIASTYSKLQNSCHHYNFIRLHCKSNLITSQRKSTFEDLDNIFFPKQYMISGKNIRNELCNKNETKNLKMFPILIGKTKILKHTYS